MSLARHVGTLLRIFRSSANKRAAHQASRAHLLEMAADPAFLTEVLRQHLERPRILATKNYPVVGIDIELNPWFGLVANCWIPLPDRNTDLSTKAIHHHGNMLLTTVTMFGAGYEHWTFTLPEPFNPARGLYRMRLRDRRQHGHMNADFVESYTPHLPMYPPDTTITLALWSSQDPTNWRDRLKRVPALQRRTAQLRSLAVRLGLRRFLALKIVENFDFHPVDGGFAAISERIEFERGPNEDHLHSLFHILQRTGNEALASVVEQRIAAEPDLPNPTLVRKLVADLRAGRPIEGRLSAGHHDVPFANFTADDIERALAEEPLAPRGKPATAAPAATAGSH